MQGAGAGQGLGAGLALAGLGTSLHGDLAIHPLGEQG